MYNSALVYRLGKPNLKAVRVVVVYFVRCPVKKTKQN